MHWGVFREGSSWNICVENKSIAGARTPLCWCQIDASDRCPTTSLATSLALLIRHLPPGLCAIYFVALCKCVNNSNLHKQVLATGWSCMIWGKLSLCNEICHSTCDPSRLQDRQGSLGEIFHNRIYPFLLAESLPIVPSFYHLHEMAYEYWPSITFRRKRMR